MDRYIARQPIFNNEMRVSAYELLYRGNSLSTAAVEDGDAATRSLLADAITVFGLPKLTNSKPAFINFTENLILDDFVKLAGPKEIVVELLQSIKISPELLEKLTELKALGYRLVLDGYDGNPYFDEILPYLGTIKVDFLSTDQQVQAQIAARFRGSGLTLLAEKIETEEDFERAKKMGYSLFQGYFFEKPKLVQNTSSSLTTSSYVRLFRELNAPEINMAQCGRIIHTDATLTYQLFKKARTLRYFRGNSVQNIMQALMLLGTNEIRRWVVLLLSRDRNTSYSEELVRAAYLRAIFAEKLMGLSPLAHRSSDGFLLGIFSMLEKIMASPLETILMDIPISQDLADALLGKTQNLFSPFLEYILLYETKDPSLILPDLDLRVRPDQIATLYMQCIVEADEAFNT